MKRLSFILPCLFVLSLFSQTTYKSFELRHFTNDPEANGETDFKGETEWMNTDQRIRFLEDYAVYSSRFFKDPDLNRKAVSNQEIDSLLSALKPQPLTKIRRTIPLNGWKAYGYREGQDTSRHLALNSWNAFKGVSVEKGSLKLVNAKVKRETDSLYWRFKVDIKIRSESDSLFSFSMGNNQKQAIVIDWLQGKVIAYSCGKAISKDLQINDWFTISIEGDFTQKRYNLIINNLLQFDYIPMSDTSISAITNFSIRSKGTVLLDNLFIFNHIPQKNDRIPYISKVICDDKFQTKPSPEGWQKSGFDDSLWETVNLPSVHGGIREEGEDYYLRKTINPGKFQKAVLEIETIDPGGEVWLNGQVISVVSTRHPVEIDVSRFLKPECDNLIAVKVWKNKSTHRMGHAPSDLNIGWFLGRTKMILTGEQMIKQVLVHTASVEDTAVQKHKISVRNYDSNTLNGLIVINYYPWFPAEGILAASMTKDVELKPRITTTMEIEVPVHAPRLWHYDFPFLYKTEVILKNRDGQVIDDFVTTTGIRTLEQKNGDFYLNGESGLLNGAQIMGFRMPIENLARYNRCAPDSIIAQELLMIKKMEGNLLRMHVHAQTDTTDGINDPRFAELADQVGMCVIWQTSGWIREGEAWNIDFEGYPKYMEQVFNHPSIVMWEAANHPNRFKQHDINDTHDFVKATYNAIAPYDQSRLISLTSSWNNTPYINYNGTLDYLGNKIQAPEEFMAKMVTRGNQDTYTGYGRPWHDLRKIPYGWVASCLEAKDKAYFNFEHEESIGQPNWNLCKGKPWYLLHSYEWDYDQGSIGRKLTFGEWRISQAWQAFSAWESIKKQTYIGYDGFSWCCLHGGANMGTYMKPLIDNTGHVKLAYYTNKMAFQKAWAGSDNVDVVYGPGDHIRPVIHYLGKGGTANLTIRLKTVDGKQLEVKTFQDIVLEKRGISQKLPGFKFKKVPDHNYVIDYELEVWDSM